MKTSLPSRKIERAKAVPFGFENPCACCREFAHAFGEHGQNRRINWKFHNPCNLLMRTDYTDLNVASLWPKSESAEAFWAVSLPRTRRGPLTKATL